MWPSSPNPWGSFNDPIAELQRTASTLAQAQPLMTPEQKKQRENGAISRMLGGTFDDPNNRQTLNASLQDMLSGLNRRPMDAVNNLQNRRERDTVRQEAQARYEQEQAMQQEQQAMQRQQMQQQMVMLKQQLPPKYHGLIDAGYPEKAISQYQADSKMTALQQNAAAAGYQPGTPEFEKFVSNAMMKPSTTINMGAGQTQHQKNQANMLDEQVKQFAAAGDQARTMKGNLFQLGDAIQKVGDTGPTEETEMALRDLFARGGINFNQERLGDLQYLRATSGELVRNLMNEAKGPQTDSDQRFLQTLVPALGVEKTANTKLLNYAESKQQLAQHFSQAAFQLQSQYPDYQSAKQAIDQLTVQYNQTPSGAIINGEPKSFISYARLLRGGKPGITMPEIIGEWNKLTGGL